MKIGLKQSKFPTKAKQKHNEVEKVAHGSLKIFSESNSVYHFLGQQFTLRTRKKENEKWKPFARFHYKVISSEVHDKKKNSLPFKKYVSA